MEEVFAQARDAEATAEELLVDDGWKVVESLPRAGHGVEPETVAVNSRLGVRWVTLPYPPTSRPIWPIDLNYGMSTACQESSEPRAVGPRALDPEALYVSMPAGPALEAGIPPGASC